MTTPLYSVGTWDTNAQAYTPQAGLTVPAINVPLATLREAVRQLRRRGYEAWRGRTADGSHDGDHMVLIERTDGRQEAEILESWKR